MGKKKEGEETSAPKSKSKLSVSAMLAIMDQRPEKPKSKPRAKPTSYLEDLDLPPSDSEEDDEMEMPGIEHEPVRRARRAAGIPTNGFAPSAKEEEKRERNNVIEVRRLERSRQEAVRDERDAFAVVVGSKTSVLDGEVGADANVKDITIDNFSVSAKGNVVLVEQEVAGDEKSAVEAVVSSNRQLMDARREMEEVRGGGGEEDDLDNDQPAECRRLAELYEQLQMLDSDTAELEAAKIFRGLGFKEEMQQRQTRSFSGGWRMRISLAGALFVQPTLLLLDEPTNNLDLRAVLYG